MAGEATVVVVDDDKETAGAYESALNSKYDVQTAYSGEDALELIDGSTDVVLLDRRMPGMSGDEVLAELRSRDFGCRVIMVTGVEPDTDIIDMDFDEYLVKPVENEDLQAAVEQMLVRNRQDETLREMFAIASKLATLEAKLDYDQLTDSEEYDELRHEFLSLQESVELPDAQGDPYLEATLENIEALLKESY